MSKARFTPTLILNIVDRAANNGEQEIVKSVLCKDAEDADRIKRIFFRTLNFKLGEKYPELKNFGYTIEEYTGKMTVEKKTPKKGKKPSKKRIPKVKAQDPEVLNVFKAEDFDKEIERLKAEKDQFLADLKAKEEAEKKRLETEEKKAKIKAEYDRMMKELESEIVDAPVLEVANG